MKISDFFNLPEIDKRENSERLKIFEKARITAPSGRGCYDIFDVYVTGINGNKMIVLSTYLNKKNESLIEFPIAIEPNQIKNYKSLN